MTFSVFQIEISGSDFILPHPENKLLKSKLVLYPNSKYQVISLLNGNY